MRLQVGFQSQKAANLHCSRVDDASTHEVVGVRIDILQQGEAVP
jgi:hypothetical protein